MIAVTLLLLTKFLVEGSSDNTTSCGNKYLRFSHEHTMCKLENKQCEIYMRGVTEDDKELILQVHNEFRSTVATGKESKAGGMPKAADMLEMVWDEELSQLAQKHAEQCKYRHDCRECRDLEHFVVGQNIGEMLITPYNSDNNKDWKTIINSFYDEYNYFDKSNIKHFVAGASDPKTQYGHLTQVIWSKTWRVGCGWTLYDQGFYNISFYVCNYGPAGNVQKKNIYEIGEPCSKCPKNSCCGETCCQSHSENNYPGLCKITNKENAPEYVFENGIYIFYCAFHDENDCKINENDMQNWKLFKSVGGNWIRSILKSGENATIVMEKPVKSDSSGNFCLNMDLREGDYAGTGHNGFSSKIDFLSDNKKMASFLLQSTNSRFRYIGYNLDLNLPADVDCKISIKFSVPSDLPSQVFDIKELSVMKGSCDRVKDL